MTRKDYVRFAAMFKVMRLHEDQATNDKWIRDVAIKDMAFATARIFAADNARFDRARFLKACGVES